MKGKNQPGAQLGQDLVDLIRILLVDLFRCGTASGVRITVDEGMDSMDRDW